MTTIVPANARLANADKAWAVSLLAERRELLAQTRLDHGDGWHVGRNADDVHCSDCRCAAGDMPSLPTMTRSEYLARNIEHVTSQMRLQADLVEFERAAILET